VKRKFLELILTYLENYTFKWISFTLF